MMLSNLAVRRVDGETGRRGDGATGGRFTVSPYLPVSPSPYPRPPPIDQPATFSTESHFLVLLTALP
jgi:hypothetical protein